MVGFIDDKNVGDFENSSLEHLHRVAASRLQRDDRRIREFGDLNLRLSNTDGLDDDHVFAERVHENRRFGRCAGDATEMSATCHRANEDVGIGEVFGETNAIAQESAVRKGRARIDRYHADRAPEFARVRDERRTERRLSDSRRSGKPNRQRTSGSIVHRPDEIRRASGLGERDCTRERSRAALVEGRSQRLRVERCRQGSAGLRSRAGAPSSTRAA